MKLLDGKVALITGAARGIGKAIALKYASEGANVAFTDLNIDENAEKTKAEIEAFGVKALAIASNAVKVLTSLMQSLSKLLKNLERLTYWLIMPESPRMD